MLGGWAWWPESDLQITYTGVRREPAMQCCSLTSTHTMVCLHITQTIAIVSKINLKSHPYSSISFSEPRSSQAVFYHGVVRSLWTPTPNQAARRQWFLGQFYFFFNLIISLIIWEFHLMNSNHTYFMPLPGPPSHPCQVLQVKNYPKSNWWC